MRLSLFPCLLLVLVASACAENTIVSSNNPPDAVIDLPVEGTSTLVGSSITFEGRVQDTVTRPEALRVTWTDGTDAVLFEGLADDTGLTTFSTDALPVGEQTVTLRVLDEDGAAGTDTIRFLVAADEPPDIEITAPEASDVLYEALPVALASMVSDGEDAATALRVTWEIDGGATLVTDAEPSTDGETLDPVSLPAGTSVLVATVRDTAGNTATDTVTVTVNAGGPNSPPSTSQPSVTPDPDLFTDSTATCAGAVGADPDGDTVTISVSWQVNGVDTGVSGASLGGVFFAKGRTVVCVATPNDGLVDGPAVASAGVLVLNSPPSAPTVTLGPAAPTVSDPLVCQVGAASDPDADALTYDLSWMVNGAAAPAWDATGLSAGDSATVPATATALSETWTCTVVAHDGTDDGPPASDAVTVGCAPGSGTEAACAGVDCLDILNGGYSIGDDWYWIDPTGSGAFQAWCDQTTDNGGWTRVLDADYSVDPCPGAWSASAQGGGSCVRAASGSNGLIRSASFDTFGIVWGEVLGTGSGWQYGSCDAFGDNPPVDLESTYGEVVSFTIGAPGSREHLFSYVCGYGASASDDSNCPADPGGAAPPSFVGGDYLCSTGNTSGTSPTGAWQPNPLWTGQWFQAAANATSAEPIEGRLIGTHDSGNEEAAVSALTLYVR